VRAHKQITVHDAPNVLTIQFKRFEFGSFGSKISRRVEFGLTLDLAPYMSAAASCGPQPYDL
jgi:ubiquitin carboxyl-terminal hydrolase 36/42